MMPPEGFEGEIPEEFQEQFQEQFQRQFEGQFEQQREQFQSSEGTGPSSEEIERMIQEETQRRIQEETQRMMEQQIQQFAPPPSTEAPPQSFLDRVGNFLAGLIPTI